MALPLPGFIRDQLALIRPVAWRRPPRILHHYTSSEGFLGILKSGSVWATDLRYLNDPEEFVFARRFITEALHKRIRRLKAPGLAALLGKATSIFESYEPHFYVSSFSEAGNLLSQWRAYAPRNGFSIGFDSRHLENLEGCFLIDCLYMSDRTSPHNGRTLVNQRLSKWISDMRRTFASLTRHTPLQYRDAIAGTFCKTRVRDLVGLALTIKHSGYAEEREWRLVSTPQRQQGTMFRLGSFGLTPYRSINFSQQDVGNRLHAIRNVTVGPTPHAAAAARATTDLLAAHSAAHASVIQCGIPYRAW